jgi:general stress protein 26
MDARERAEKLVGESETVVLATVDVEGRPDVRAMLAPRHREGLRRFWLTTNTSSRKVNEIDADPRAVLYFVDERSFVGLTLYGTMEALRDEASRRLIWKPTDTIYYSQGVNDPDYTVLRFTATTARLYESLSVEEFGLG